MKPRIDLNCDMGELFGENYSNFDQQIMPYVSSANISCGAHSGNSELTGKTILLAKEYGVAIGAHPSYPDRENFGRSTMKISLSDLMYSLRDQLARFSLLCSEHDVHIHHIKAHGALYNDLVINEKLSKSYYSLIKDLFPGIKIYGLSSSSLAEICQNYDLEYVHEVFSDRRYEDSNRLQSRKEQGSVMTEFMDIKEQLTLFTKNKVKDIHGKIHELRTDTVCLHGDTPGAVSMIKQIHQFLKEQNFDIIAP